jgi:hypothetical protein
MPLLLEEGAALVRFAREAMRTYLVEGREPDPPKDVPSSLLQLRNGVFLTLEKYPGMEMRGYIGFPYPETPLVFTIVRAAIGTAVGDMRFQEVGVEELDRIVIRVTVTSEPKKLSWKDPRDLVRQIEVGRDGLIAQAGRHVGRLLPQVAVERHWNEEEFLNNLCIHAGLPGYAWQEGKVEISTFTAQIFEEEAPGGNVKEVRLPTY